MLPIVAAVAAAQAMTLFAPPPGQPLRIVTERVEGEGTERRSHRIERLVRFARDGEGWRAEVLLVAADSQGPPAAQGMFDAGYAAVAGRTMVFRLDAAGRVTAIDDRDVHWQAFCDGVKAMIALRRSDTPAAKLPEFAERVAAPVCGLPPERRQGVFASLVTPLVAEEAAEPPGERPIRLPGVSPLGGPATLTGTRRIEADGPLMRSLTRAAADVTGPDGALGHVEIETVRNVDPFTGLLTHGIETVTGTTAGRTTQRVTTVQVRRQPADSWP